MILPDIVFVFRHAIEVDIGRAHERHNVESSDSDSLQVGLGRFLELHGDVSFETKYVGRTHFTFQIHQEARIGPLKFDQSRRDPERAQPFGDRKTNLAAQCRRCPIKRAVQAKRRFFHPLGRLEHLHPFRRQPDTIDVSGHQRGVVGFFQQRDSLFQKVRRRLEFRGGCPEAADAGDFQKYPHRIPIRHPSG